MTTTKFEMPIISIALLVIAFGGYLQATSLIDFYKKGPIVMTPNPDFANFDYGYLFYDSNKSIAVGPDGKIFVANAKQHNISIFKDGRLIKTVGQMGEGPTDLYYPGNLGILDDKYLIINQYSLSRKISVFDLEGNFVNVIKIIHPVWNIAPLSENKIAILIGNSIEYKKYSKTNYRVLIKNILTGEEKYAWSLTTDIKSKNNVIGLTAGFYSARILLLKIGEGNFLVGYSGLPELSIYSKEGEKIKSFPVRYLPKKITSEMREEFRQVIEDHSKGNHFIKDAMKRVDWKEVFPEYTPYYSNIAVDSDNNILVFEHNGFERVKERKFQVYNFEGMFQCESRIDFGKFKAISDFQLIFTNGYIYSFLNRSDTNDILMQFIKIIIK